MAKKVNLTEKLKLYFGFDSFKGEQEAIINHLLAGNSAFVLMPTGGGKEPMLSVTLLAYGGYSHCCLSTDSLDEKSSGCHQWN